MSIRSRARLHKQYNSVPTFCTLNSALSLLPLHLAASVPYNARLRQEEFREVWKEPSVAKRSPLAEKLDEVKDRIAAAAVKAKREPAEVTLIAVTKTAAPEQIREILTLGVTDLGESRVQVLTQRAGQINEFFRRMAQSEENAADKIHWHMIGHLQRNKVKPALPLVHMIQSIDSLRLAEELDVQCAKLGRKLPVLLQVNASEEAQKFGIAVGAAVHLAEQIDSMPNLQLAGLMTMGPLDEDPAKIRQT